MCFQNMTGFAVYHPRVLTMSAKLLEIISKKDVSPQNCRLTQENNYTAKYFSICWIRCYTMLSTIFMCQDVQTCKERIRGVFLGE